MENEIAINLLRLLEQTSYNDIHAIMDKFKYDVTKIGEKTNNDYSGDILNTLQWLTNIVEDIRKLENIRIMESWENAAK